MNFRRDLPQPPVLYAAEHVLLPVSAHPYAIEGLKELDQKISRWKEAAEMNVNYVGAVPTMLSPHSRRTATEDTALHESMRQLHQIIDKPLKIFAPGIEHRQAFATAQIQGRPVTDLAATRQGRRDLGPLPAALAKTTLTLLTAISKKEEDLSTQGWPIFDVEKLEHQLRNQDHPDQ